jgi:RNA polymerase sigma-70 factor (ECF subfamily)
MSDDIDGVVRRVLRGEIDDYAEIVDRFQKDVWRIACVAIQERDATSDLVQEIFVEAYSHLGRYELGRDFGAWIRGVARNHVREMLRRRARESRLLQAYRKVLIERLGDSDTAERREEAMAEAHSRCREQLPEHSAQLLDLRYEHSLSHQAIAAKVGKSMEAVKQLLYRIHILLRDCIQKKLVEV